MAEISKIITGGNEYDIKDTTARESAEEAKALAEQAAQGVGSAGDADYYAHWNVRVQQITADMPIIDRYMVEEEGAPSALLNKRGVAMLELNEEFSYRLWWGGKWTGYPVAIMHPKQDNAVCEQGHIEVDFDGTALSYLLVSKYIRCITWLRFPDGILDLTLFTGDMPFPSLTICDGPPSAVYVQKGRKAELLALTNWSDLVIEELDTWSDVVMEEV